MPTVEAARQEVLECLEPEMLSRVLLVGGSVVGWVGARHDYGFVWELHPLAVDEAHRGRGYGRALVEDVERLVAERGALTLRLGTSDEVGRTTLDGVDLFGDPARLPAESGGERAASGEVLASHGLRGGGRHPDAEGPGKPDILLAKRVGGGA